MIKCNNIHKILTINIFIFEPIQKWFSKLNTIIQVLNREGGITFLELSYNML